jgi:hypothetical protein
MQQPSQIEVPLSSKDLGPTTPAPLEPIDYGKMKNLLSSYWTLIPGFPVSVYHRAVDNTIMVETDEYDVEYPPTFFKEGYLIAPFILIKGEFKTTHYCALPPTCELTPYIFDTPKGYIYAYFRPKNQHLYVDHEGYSGIHFYPRQQVGNVLTMSFFVWDDGYKNTFRGKVTVNV